MNPVTEPDSQASAFVPRSYTHPPGAFDEMEAAPGVVRPHWEPLMRGLNALGSEGLRDRFKGVRQLLREHGVTYNIYAEGGSAERTWELDMVPLVIDAAEWAGLEAGLIQRTRLLNLVLADIYGPQHLVRAGLLPPALLQANPGFLRCCHGIRPPRDLYLSLHAVDLTRAPNGRWWVLSDRTQAPSGVGYALENRAILSRYLPDEFHDCQVRGLDDFFTRRKAGLLTLAPWTTTPNIVLHTPGPYTETYFEQAYLASYLGYPLVEGSDLTVRGRRVFLKTLEGLQQVDIIIRRVDDTWCDPLELRADSVLGVPGLVDAARAGTVAISNALGVGAVETTAILAFLPALAKHLLGETLLIPNVATWWCGQRSEREYTLGKLRSMVIKRAFVGRQPEPSFGDGSDPADLDALAARILANPHDYVAQERVALSTAPVWNGDLLEPRPLVLRCYVCATPEGFAVMPGGLTRVSSASDAPIVSSRFGGGSKDTWARGSAPAQEIESAQPQPIIQTQPAHPAQPERLMGNVPSRVVENLFWLGRYTERLEDRARILRTGFGWLAGEGGPVGDQEMAALTRWLAHSRFLPAQFGGRFEGGGLISELCELVFGRSRAGSVRDLLARVSLIVPSVRDRLSGDTWRVLNQLQNDFPPAISQATPAAIVEILHRVIFELAAFSGVEMENMPRGRASLFLDIGRRIERSLNLIANLRSVLATNASAAAALAPLLDYTDNTMTYRRLYLARPELPLTFVLLLVDDANPRSLAFQFNALKRHFAELPGAGDGRFEETHFEQLTARLVETDVFALTTQGDPGLASLADRLTELFEGCWKLSDLISAAYFSHVAARIS